MKLLCLSLLCILLEPVVALALLAGDAVSSKSVCKLQPFDLTDVRLLDGPFRDAMLRDKAYLLSLEPDRLLHVFRLNAGLPSSAEPLGGWETPKIEIRGHFVGHYLSACALMFASTGDEQVKERAALMVRELARCQAALGTSGYLSAFPESFIDRVETTGKVWAPYYTLHKILAGLLEIHTRCGNTQALDVARRFGDWVAARNERLSDEQMQKMLAVEHGGMNEAMANLYALTRDEKHLRAARRFCHKHVLDPLAARQDRLAGLHANTQFPKVIGAARLYELTGEERYRTLVEFFWDRVVNHHSYAIGGNSDHEHFGPADQLAQRVSPWTAETCNAHNMLKLTRHVFAWNPNAAQADYYERALYNQILATQDPRTGMMGYHVPLHGAWFMPYNTPCDSFWCCTGTGAESHAKYGDSIYWHDNRSLYVNLFIASELTWKEKGLVLRQETRFPEQDTTRLSLQCEKPVPLSLRIRRPAWAGVMVVLLNGKRVEAPPLADGYVELRREWKNGDRVEVRLPMSLRLEPMPDDPNRVAICYGPVVLAGALGSEGIVPPMPYAKSQSDFFKGKTAPPAPVLLTQGRPVSEWIEAVPGKPLTFTTKGVGKPRDVTLVAFHTLPPQRYTIYWDLFTREQWDKRRAAIDADERRERELNARTVDVVRIGEFEPERAHNFKGERSDAGVFDGRLWRHARDGGSFAYEMKVPSGVSAILLCTYWGGDGGKREFDILVDKEKIATQTLAKNKPGEFFDVEYPIPARLTAGKLRVTIKFQAHPHATAGGVFGLRVLKMGERIH
ncbi:MAG: beta-L-arabinofuranosidase domain-containing protein [Verrucomicrobiia bacterium]